MNQSANTDPILAHMQVFVDLCDGILICSMTSVLDSCWECVEKMQHDLMFEVTALQEHQHKFATTKFIPCLCSQSEAFAFGIKEDQSMTLTWDHTKRWANYVLLCFMLFCHSLRHKIFPIDFSASKYPKDIQRRQSVQWIPILMQEKCLWVEAHLLIFSWSLSLCVCSYSYLWLSSCRMLISTLPLTSIQSWSDYYLSIYLFQWISPLTNILMVF